MIKKVENKKSYSIKMLLIYGLVVFAIVIISILIRAVTIVNASKFDGQHRFTLSLGDEKKPNGYISFEPITSSLSILKFSSNNNLSYKSLNSITGIIPDGFLKSKKFISTDGDTPSILQSYLFQFNSLSRNITIYDLMQFILYAYKIPVSTISVEEINLSTESNEIDKIIALLCSDSIIISDKESIQIINAAGIARLGSRLERVINNLGGNVVSVQTAKEIEPVSKIQYFKKETYTLNKISKLLPFPKEIFHSKAIADIIIIIGEDYKDTSLF